MTVTTRSAQKMARPVTTRSSQPMAQKTQSSMNGFLSTLKIGSYFVLWYALNVIYNILNKKVLNVIPAPLTVGTIQLGIGSVVAVSLWLTKLRTSPKKLTKEGREICVVIGAYHSSGLLLSLISIGAGAVSFTHIVKALEPLFSALVSGVVFHVWMKPQVYVTLLPVVGGVGYACLNDGSFSWLAFWTALGSNVAFALRAVVSKAAMTHTIGENVNSVNLFGIITLTSFAISIPVAILGEGLSFLSYWNDAINGTITSKDLWFFLIASGIFHYLNNEVMYLALGNVHPVTLAVGNTLKRVFIIVASVIVFRNPISMQVGIGSAVSIAGVLLYSLTKQFYEKQVVRKDKKV